MAKSKTWQYAQNQVLSGDTAANTMKKITWLWKAIFMGDATAISNWKDESSGSITPTGAWKMYWSCNGGGTTAGTNFGASTTSTGTQTLDTTNRDFVVGATANFPASGTFVVIVSSVPYIVTYASISNSTTFHNCTIATGSISVGNSTAVVDNRDFYGGGSTFDATKVVNATAGSNHSWFVLYSPTNFGTTGQGPIWLVVDMSTATSGNVGDVQISKTAPTGGTGTAAPSATDKVGLQTTNFQFARSTSATTLHMHGILTTDGIVRIWWSVDGDGYITSTFRMEALTGADATDQWPFAFIFFNITSAPPTFGNTLDGVNAIGVAATTGNPKNNNSCFRSRNFDGTSIVNLTWVLPCYMDSVDIGNGSFNLVVTGTHTGTSQTTKKWDLIPLVGLYSLTPGYTAYRGVLPDTWMWAGVRTGTASSRILSDGTFDPTNLVMSVGEFAQPAITQHLL